MEYKIRCGSCKDHHATAARDEYESARLSAPLGLCTRNPAHGAAEVPWAGERLCWPCTDADLELLAKAAEIEPELCGQECKHPVCASPEDRLAEALAGAYLAMAGQDPELAEELVRESNYLKEEAA